MASISYVNPYFRAPSPLKPLKSNSRYQNLPGEPLIAHSDTKTTKIYQKTAKNLFCLNFVSFYEAILGPLKACFDQLDR